MSCSCWWCPPCCCGWVGSSALLLQLAGLGIQSQDWKKLIDLWLQFHHSSIQEPIQYRLWEMKLNISVTDINIMLLHFQGPYKKSESPFQLFDLNFQKLIILVLTFESVQQLIHKRNSCMIPKSVQPFDESPICWSAFPAALFPLGNKLVDLQYTSYDFLNLWFCT